MVTRIVTLLLGLLLVIVHVVGNAYESSRPIPGILTLYLHAMEYDPELRVAKAARSAGAEVVVQARAGLLPAVSLYAEHGRLERRTQEIEGGAATWEDHFSHNIVRLNVTQPVLDLEAWYQYQAGESQYWQAEAKYQVANQDLAERLIAAYFRVLRAQSDLATRQAESDSLQRQQSQVQRQLEAGVVSRIDVLEVNAELSRVAVDQVRSQSELDQALRALEAITGQKISSVSPLHQVPAHFQLGTIASLRARAETNNPRLQLARYETQTSRQNAKAAKVAHYPILSLDLSAQRDISESAEQTPPGTGELITDTTSIALRLEMPVFSGGRISSQRRESLHLLEQSRQNFRLVKEEVLSELDAQHEALHAHHQAMVAAQLSISAQEAALEAAEKGHEAGVRDLVDVLRARRERFAAADVLNDAKYDYVTTLARLYRLTGSLHQHQIQQFNDWLATP